MVHIASNSHVSNLMGPLRTCTTKANDIAEATKEGSAVSQEEAVRMINELATVLHTLSQAVVACATGVEAAKREAGHASSKANRMGMGFVR